MMRKISILAMLIILAGCGGRVPSQAKTADMAKKYFTKYGKKYSGTAFATSQVSAVEVKGVKEIQKNVANGFILVKLSDGTEVPVIMTFIRKVPLGWRTTGWEQVER